MSKTDRIIGEIANLSPEARQAREKRDAYRKKLLVCDDAVFDMERGLFMIHGKHPTLAGIDAVVALDMPSLLQMFAGVVPTVLVPMLHAFAAQNPPPKAG